MKEFEKWFENITKDCEIPDNICDKVGNCNACKELQKIGWQASLEWTLTQETDLQATEIADAIRKEIQE